MLCSGDMVDVMPLHIMLQTKLISTLEITGFQLNHVQRFLCTFVNGLE